MCDVGQQKGIGIVRQVCKCNQYQIKIRSELCCPALQLERERNLFHKLCVAFFHFVAVATFICAEASENQSYHSNQ